MPAGKLKSIFGALRRKTVSPSGNNCPPQPENARPGGASAEVLKNRKKRGPLIDRFLPKHSIGAELGVLKGDFSRVLLEFSEPRELHLIDPWYFLTPHWSWVENGNSTVDAVCKVLQENRREINERRVFVHIQDDIKVLMGFADNYFDWVYVDSSHAYEHTKKELELLKCKVKNRGIICGDDWRPDPGHRHHGVYRAVMEFTKKYDYEIIYSNEQDRQWFIKRR